MRANQTNVQVLQTAGQHPQGIGGCDTCMGRAAAGMLGSEFAAEQEPGDMRVLTPLTLADGLPILGAAAADERLPQPGRLRAN
jgi:hypothetical protein